MQKYIIDGQFQEPDDFEQIRKRRARSWKTMIGEDVIFTTWDATTGFRRLTENGLTPLQLTDGIVILHRPSDALITEIAAERNRFPHLVAIKISGDPYDGPQSKYDWLYTVCTPVSYSDEGFSLRFKLFWEAYIKIGNLAPDNVRLLEPITVPEPLLSYACAVRFDLNILNEMTTIIKETDDAYSKVQPYLKTLLYGGKEVSDPNTGLPPVSDFTDGQYHATSTRYKAICNAIDLLREDA